MKFRIDLKILFFLALFYFTHQLKIYLIIMIFAFLHELSHLIVGLILGFKPKIFEIMPLGFCINMKPKTGDYKQKILKSTIVDLKYILITLAGPMLNLFFVILFSKIFFVSEQMLKSNDEIFFLKQMIVYSNLLLFIFNMLPIYPLDGRKNFKMYF